MGAGKCIRKACHNGVAECGRKILQHSVLCRWLPPPHRLEPNTSAATLCATSEGTCLFSRSLIKDFQSKVYTYFPNWAGATVVRVPLEMQSPRGAQPAPLFIAQHRPLLRFFARSVTSCLIALLWEWCWTSCTSKIGALCLKWVETKGCHKRFGVQLVTFLPIMGPNSGQKTPDICNWYDILPI